MRGSSLRYSCALAAAVCLGVSIDLHAGRRGDDIEVHLSSGELEKLGDFETHALNKADKSFNEGDFRRSAAEYQAFILQYGRSRAVPYALVRWGRSLHRANKRNDALKQYQEVLDYFPNVIKYAGAALYYKGLAHWQNGDVKLATKAWAQMARDKDYSKHPLAAGAINRLADELLKQNQAETAVAYYRQVAIDFRNSNDDESDQARGKAIYHYVRRALNEAKLRSLYFDTKGFDHYKARVPDDPKDLATDRGYWGRVLELVDNHGRFDDDQAELRDNYYRYWVEQLGGKFADWDGYQIKVIGFQRIYERDDNAWMKRLDDLFQRNQTQGDYDRVLRWIRLYAGHKAKAMKYYEMLDFAKMSPDQIVSMMFVALKDLRDKPLAMNTFQKIPLVKLSDDRKAEIAGALRREGPELIEPICRSFQDAEYGKKVLLDFYASQRDVEKGLPLADDLATSERYACEALWIKASLLESAEKYAQAISVYRLCDDRAPENVFAIARCYAADGKMEPARAELKQIESFFKSHRAEAALRVAFLYRDFKKDELYQAALNYVLDRYPESGQSKVAHEKLEEKGFRRIKGGTDAEE